MKKIQYILLLILLPMIAVSCSQEVELGDAQGYLALKVESRTSTVDVTRADAPADYDARVLHVEIRDANGTVVKSTDDYANDQNFQGQIKLNAGAYTIVAHSANWDGNGSGFDTPYYYGTANVTVEAQNLKTATVVCTQANVKITVNYDAGFETKFKSAVATATSSVEGVNPLQFVMGQTLESGYIPAGDFDIDLAVVNNNDASHTLSRSFNDVKAREHYILNFKLAQEGNLGDGTTPGISVDVDESTNTYTFTFEVPTTASTSIVTRAANAWSTFAMLRASVTAKTDKFAVDGLTMQWRKSGETDWTDMAGSELTMDDADDVTATLKGLTPETSYEYRMRYVEGADEILSDPVSFTTEAQTPLYNGGFENWWMDGKVAYANEQGTSYWDSSNKGGATFGGSNTTETTEVVHGGSKAAKLESKYIVIKFAAASLYTGTFGDLVGTKGAKLNWGVPFTGRPTALKGFMQYAPVAVDRTGSGLPAGAPAKGEMDQCGMYCALVTEQLHVDNTDIAGTFPDWENDERVVAYGALPQEQNVSTNGEWREVNIPLVYHDINKQPTHLVIVFSASKYGDYFHGGTGSTMYLDDFSLEYGDNPTIR